MVSITIYEILSKLRVLNFTRFFHLAYLYKHEWIENLLRNE